MNRPLVVTDCDEVLLHMVRHFREWLGATHAIDFRMEGQNFANSMRRAGSDTPLSDAEMWQLLGQFFDTEMDSQIPIAGAVNAVREMQREADVVVLTNLTDSYNQARRRQLQMIGIDAQVFTNQGPKGGALRKIIEEHGASRALFIDDIAVHHKSAAEHIPHVRRLHFCGEPALAPHVPCALKAGDAHARIDNWADALPWILAQLHDHDLGETA
jgi:hypothetical protein